MENNLGSWGKSSLKNLVITLNWILIRYYLYNWHADFFFLNKGIYYWNQWLTTLLQQYMLLNWQNKLSNNLNFALAVQSLLPRQCHPSKLWHLPAAWGTRKAAWLNKTSCRTRFVETVSCRVPNTVFDVELEKLPERSLLSVQPLLTVV